jgi:hypothetical protein
LHLTKLEQLKPIQPVSGEGGAPALTALHLLVAQVISRELVLVLASQPAPAIAQPTQPKDLIPPRLKR